MLAFVAMYALAYAFGQYLEQPEQWIGATFWPAAGVYLATLARLRPSQWPAPVVATGAIAAIGSLALGTTLSTDLFVWAFSSGVTMLAAGLLRLLLGDVPDLTRLRDVMYWIGASGLLPPIARYTSELDSTQAASEAWQVWWLGDVLGVFAVGSLLLTWRDRASDPARRGSVRELCILLSVGAVLSLTVAQEYERGAHLLGNPALLYPLTTWAALRFGSNAAALCGTALATLLTVSIRLEPLGPSGAAYPLEEVVNVQLSLAIAIATALCAAAVLTARLRAEDRLAEQQRELQRVDKLSTLGTLVASVGHELRSPNQLLQLNLAALERVVEDATDALEGSEHRIGGLSVPDAREDTRKLLADAHRATERLAALGDDLRSFARRDRADEVAACNPTRAAEASVKMCGARLRKATDAFRFVPTGELPDVALSQRRLEQVLVNLLLNACDALPAPDRAIELRLRASQDAVVFEVRDEGAGMTDEQIAHVTEPFFTTKTDGTGLGLHVCDRIVRDAGGSMTFSAQPGLGTTVVVSLPLA